MNSKWKEKVQYAGTFIFVFIIPGLWLLYFGNNNRNTFYERVDKDHQQCRKYAKENNVETRWCDEIKEASETNFNLSDNFFDMYLVLLIFQPVLFVLIIGLMNLKKQVEELKQNIDV